MCVSKYINHINTKTFYATYFMKSLNKEFKFYTTVYNLYFESYFYLDKTKNSVDRQKLCIRNE